LERPISALPRSEPGIDADSLPNSTLDEVQVEYLGKRLPSYHLGRLVEWGELADRGGGGATDICMKGKGRIQMQNVRYEEVSPCMKLLYIMLGCKRAASWLLGWVQFSHDRLQLVHFSQITAKTHDPPTAFASTYNSTPHLRFLVDSFVHVAIVPTKRGLELLVVEA
jgi:hypothetical protein